MKKLFLKIFFILIFVLFLGGATIYFLNKKNSSWEGQWITEGEEEGFLSGWTHNFKGLLLIKNQQNNVFEFSLETEKGHAGHLYGIANIKDQNTAFSIVPEDREGEKIIDEYSCEVTFLKSEHEIKVETSNNECQHHRGANGFFEAIYKK